MRAKYELADIVRQYGDSYRQATKLPLHHHKVLNAIERCRTAALGGHVERCSDCQEERIAYNSCRNRHCPKCQGNQRDKWIAARKEDLLDCTYYHVVFTLPEAFNLFCLHYAEQMYDILFHSSKETIQSFGRDKKYLGAETGAISILHTWGQNLWLHPHVHCIVPGGGIDQQGKWRTTRSEGKYLYPVKAMSKVYRGKFMERFKVFMQANGMEITAELHKELYAKDWVVYAKRPFGGAEQVIEYLGRYTHKIAISNHRLQNIAEGKISFRYKDYRDGGKSKTMTLQAEEFLRRFCMHILPRGYRKIRHYGILSSRNKAKLKVQQQKMKPAARGKEQGFSYYEKIHKKPNPAKQCPCCKKGIMERVLSFKANAPPLINLHKTRKQIQL